MNSIEIKIIRGPEREREKERERERDLIEKGGVGPGARHCCAETGASAFALNARKASGVRHHTTGRRWRRDYPTGTVVSGVVKVVVEVTPLEVVPKIVAIAVVASVMMGQ